MVFNRSSAKMAYIRYLVAFLLLFLCRWQKQPQHGGRLGSAWLAWRCTVGVAMECREEGECVLTLLGPAASCRRLRTADQPAAEGQAQQQPQWVG
jgi:hypothetical protein